MLGLQAGTLDSDSRRDLMHLSREFKEGRETSQVTIRRASQAEGTARAKALREACCVETGAGEAKWPVAGEEAEEVRGAEPQTTSAIPRDFGFCSK